MYGAFFLIGMISALASSGNVIAAASGPVLYLLNASSGLVIAQQDLGENVTCVVPYGAEFLAATTSAGLTHFVIIANNTFIPVQNVVEGNETLPALVGTSTGCASYEGYFVSVVESNGTLKAYFFKLNGTDLVKEMELDAPEAKVKGGEVLLFYGPSGLYVYSEGNYTQITNVTVKDADYLGGVLFYAANGTVVAYSMTAESQLYVWKPTQGKACAVLALSPNEVVVGLKNINMGVALLVDGSLKVTVGVPNVYKLSKGDGYVAAATAGGGNLGEGVAVIPLSWLMK
ncbi:MAG: hypothetical protein GXO07_01255 [Crenarchaeota archaeon]|nr:hypothetical protein [Thermoproteota archaeon]